MDAALSNSPSSGRRISIVQPKKVTEMKLQDTNVRVRSDGNNKAAAWILFWLLGYPIALVMFIALSDLKLM